MRLMEKLTRKGADMYTASPVVISFLGDSVTQGCFEMQPSSVGIGAGTDYCSVYHARLRVMLSRVFPNVPVNIINAGIGGDNAIGGSQRVERDIIANQPDLVVVCFGLNDAPAGLEHLDDYTGALGDIIDKLSNADIETIFMTPNMLNTRVEDYAIPEALQSYAHITMKTQNSGVMDTYMDAAKAVCTDRSVPVCDCYAKWKKLASQGVDTTRLLANHINHPTREMHELFAASLFEKIIFS